MSISLLELQRDAFLRTISVTGVDQREKWRILVCDAESKELLDTATKVNEVLNLNITDILLIEDKRESQPDMRAIYFLTPRAHIVDWLKADISRKRYEFAFPIWTSPLPPNLYKSLMDSESRKQQIPSMTSLRAGFFPRESQLVSFRQDSSFQVLFNAQLDSFVKRHLDELAEQIVSLCVMLGEYPLVRYYNPETRHDAAVLCKFLAGFVQDALDAYAANNRDFPPVQTPSQQRPRAILMITDRSMDLMAPLLHELTYQAMAMDLLPMKVTGDTVQYSKPSPPDEEKGPEDEYATLDDNDHIWVENRHLHMKDLLIKLSNDFKKFQAKNSQFADNGDQPISVNTIKDMLAGLPEFQEGKCAFSLHIDMAEKCAKMFEGRNLLNVTSVEQSLATRLDEDDAVPRGMAPQLVQLLDDDSVAAHDRLRLLIMYILYRDGILTSDTDKLLRHAQLYPDYLETIYNLEQLGARVRKTLDQKGQAEYRPLFEARKSRTAVGEEISLSRFEPAMRYMLEKLCQGDLDQTRFPYRKPQLDNSASQGSTQQTSLRSANKPTWTKPNTQKPRQRIIVFMAGGATYSEARVCYEVSRQLSRDVYLATTHMWTPKKFTDEVKKLSLDARGLRLNLDKLPDRMPAWMQEPVQDRARPQQPPTQQRPSNAGVPPGPRPPTEAMQNMNLKPTKPQQGSSQPSSAQTPLPTTTAGSFSPHVDPSAGKLKKENKADKGEKEKKGLRGMFHKSKH